MEHDSGYTFSEDGKTFHYWVNDEMKSITDPEVIKQIFPDYTPEKYSNNEWESRLVLRNDNSQLPGESWDEYYERTKDSGNWIRFSLNDLKTGSRHSQVAEDSKQMMAVYNYDTEQYDKFEIVPTGFKNVETGEIIDSPFTKRHLNEMALQTDLMKSALGEKDN